MALAPGTGVTGLTLRAVGRRAGPVVGCDMLRANASPTVGVGVGGAHVAIGGA